MAGVLRIVNAAAKSAPRRLALASSSSCEREFSALVTPLEEFPGTPLTTPSAGSPSTVSSTTLPSGLTVISEDSNIPCTISLTFPNAGSYSETPSEAGASLVNKYLSFRSGSGLSSAVITRNLQDDGATPFVTSSRYGSSVGFTAAKEKAIRLIPLLATVNSFEKWDVRDAKKFAAIEVEESMTSVQTVLSESLYSAAYGAQSAAGKTQYSSSSPTDDAIKTFRDRSYVLNGAVLAATGISDHAQFAAEVEYAFSESHIGNKPASNGDQTPAFVGGEARVHAPSAGVTHLALAFPMESGSTALGQVAAACIDMMDVDGAVSGFATPLGGGRLIGAYAGPVSAANPPAVLDKICGILTGPAPTADMVERVKALAKAKAVFEMEDGSKNLAEAMTSAVLENISTEGKSLPTSIGEEYDAITAADVKKVFDGMKVQPAIASVGDIASVPYLGTIAPRFS